MLELLLHILDGLIMHDISIFESTKDEILEALQSYEKVEMLDTVLFIVDEKMCEVISQARRLLELEYGSDEMMFKKYSIDSIVKYLNGEGIPPAHTYTLREKTFHRQINDPDKVREMLDTEFKLWQNRLLKEVTSKIATKGLSPEQIQAKRSELNAEIAVAQKKHEYIKENFDNLEVKISSLVKRPSFGVVIRYWVIGATKETKIRLKNTIPNVLYFKEKPVEVPPHNKIKEFLERSENPYGEVYYIEKDL